MARISASNRVKYLESKLENALKPFGWLFISQKKLIKSYAQKHGARDAALSPMILLLTSSASVQANKKTDPCDELVFDATAFNSFMTKFNEDVSRLKRCLDYLLTPEKNGSVVVTHDRVAVSNITVNRDSRRLYFGAIISVLHGETFKDLDLNIEADNYRKLGGALVVRTTWGRAWVIHHKLNTPLDQLKIVVDADEPMSPPFPDASDPLNTIRVDSANMDCASGGVAIKRLSHYEGTEDNMRAILADAIRRYKDDLRRENAAKETKKPKTLVPSSLEDVARRLIASET